MDFAALKAEIDTDPLTLGYSGKTDQEILDLLNSLTTGRTRDRRVIPTHEVFAAITAADVSTICTPGAAPQPRNFNYLLLLASLREIDVSKSTIRSEFSNIFSGASLSAIQALQTETISRAEELGFGILRLGEVLTARYQT